MSTLNCTDKPRRALAAEPGHEFALDELGSHTIICSILQKYV
jgi:hypothetical protein